MAVLTDGGSAAVEGSGEAATIAEEIGGEAGTIDRMSAFAEDEGSVDREIETVISDRKALASKFYENSGYIKKAADAHMKGIDFNETVEASKISKGTILEQKQIPGAPRGHYYSEMGTPATKVGINPMATDDKTGELVERVGKKYIAKKDVTVLKSKAAAVKDNWSTDEAFQTEGGATQYFSSDSNTFMELIE